MTWHDLLFAHWPVDPAIMRSLLPSPLGLDLWEGKAWVGVVPFWMSGIAPVGVPNLPILSKFSEINVRTYAVVNGVPGVYFFSLDATQSLSIWGARKFFHLPYFKARISHSGEVKYRSTRIEHGAPSAEFKASYRPVGEVFHAEKGTLEHWLAERYCLYSVSPQGRVFRGDVHHDPWPLQRAECEIATNTMAEWLGLNLSSPSQSLLFAKRLQVVAWTLLPV